MFFRSPSPQKSFSRTQPQTTTKAERELDWRSLGLQAIDVPSDGNCFYHAIMTDIFHAAVKNNIPEDSKTAQAIKTKLLPKIATLMNQAEAENPSRHLHFEGLSLHDAFMAILRRFTVVRQSAESQMSEEDFLLSKSKPLWSLTPALLQVMLESLENSQAEASIKKQFQSMSSWFLMQHPRYGKQLQFSDDDRAAAKFQFQESGHYAYLDDTKKKLQTLYRRAFRRARDLNSSKSNFSAPRTPAFKKAAASDYAGKIGFLNENVFETLWQESKALFLSLFIKESSRNGTMWATEAHMKAVEDALKCNINLCDSHGGVTPICPKQQETDGVYSFYYSSRPDPVGTKHHYVAMVSPGVPASELQVESQKTIENGNQSRPYKRIKTEGSFTEVPKVQNEAAPVEIVKAEEIEEIQKEIAQSIDDIKIAINNDEKKREEIEKLKAKPNDLVRETIVAVEKRYFTYFQQMKEKPVSKEQAMDARLAMELQDEELRRCIPR